MFNNSKVKKISNLLVKLIAYAIENNREDILMLINERTAEINKKVTDKEIDFEQSYIELEKMIEDLKLSI